MENIHELTERERQLMLEVVRGCSNQEISDILVIEVSTVQNHLSNIYRKLDVPSRNRAAAICFEALLSAAMVAGTIDELWAKSFTSMPNAEDVSVSSVQQDESEWSSIEVVR